MRDFQLGEGTHRDRERNGVVILATLRSMGLITMRLDDMVSIANGMTSVSHDIRHLLELLAGAAKKGPKPHPHETSNEPWVYLGFDD